MTPTTGWDRDETDNVGGYEVYMAGDDKPDDEEGADAAVDVPVAQSSTGAGARRNARQQQADPAVYKAAGDEEDEGILVSTLPSWNTLSIVLRDKGTLKFVKYVSESAPGDRWDFAGILEVEPSEDDDDEEEEEVGEE